MWNNPDLFSFCPGFQTSEEARNKAQTMYCKSGSLEVHRKNVNQT